MIDKNIEDSAEMPADKPTELTDSEVEDVAGGAKPATIYDKKGVKFE